MNPDLQKIEIEAEALIDLGHELKEAAGLGHYFDDELAYQLTISVEQLETILRRLKEMAVGVG